jgi:hypothetical protein
VKGVVVDFFRLFFFLALALVLVVYLVVGSGDTLVLRLLRLCCDGEVTTLGQVLFTLLLAELDIELVAVAAKLLGLECVLSLEVLGTVLWDFIHLNDPKVDMGGWESENEAALLCVFLSKRDV